MYIAKALHSTENYLFNESSIMALGGKREGAGQVPLVQRLGVSQLVKDSLAKHWKTKDPEAKLVRGFADVFLDESLPMYSRLAAGKVLMEYIWGKPKQLIELESPDLKFLITKSDS